MADRIDIQVDAGNQGGSVEVRDRRSAHEVDSQRPLRNGVFLVWFIFKAVDLMSSRFANGRPTVFPCRSQRLLEEFKPFGVRIH
jgi:hypothetical protein